MKTVDILLFEHFTLLDAFGPAEVFGRLQNEYQIRYVSVQGSMVSGSTGASVLTEAIVEESHKDILIVPGGWGTRALVNDHQFLKTLDLLCHQSEYVLSVCSGSALLAKAGVLDNKEATTNKMAWDWVVDQGINVKWNREARWVVDGKLYSSAGITAGVDMALGFVANFVG